MRFCLILIFVLSGICFPLQKINDNSSVRKDYKKLILAPNLETSNSQKTISNVLLDFKVKVVSSVNKKGSVLFFLNLPKAKNSKMLYEGNYIIFKDKKSEIEKIQIFLANDPNIYIQARPKDEITFLDLYLFNKNIPFITNIKVSMPILEFVFKNFNDIMDMTKGKIDWSMFIRPKILPDWNPIKRIVSKIDKYISKIPESDDGIMNEDCNIVSYDDHSKERYGLSSRGFIKWIIDGFYYPVSKQCININFLKKDYYDYRSKKENSGLYPKTLQRNIKSYLDSYSMLDYVRNLSMALVKFEDEVEEVPPDAYDIKLSSYVTYFDELGYNIENLKQILYILAVTHPGVFYVGTAAKNVSKSNSFIQHYSPMAIFSWFGKDGDFKAVIFNGKKEYIIDNYIKTHKNEYVYLVMADFYSRLFELPSIK